MKFLQRHISAFLLLIIAAIMYGSPCYSDCEPIVIQACFSRPDVQMESPIIIIDTGSSQEAQVQALIQGAHAAFHDFVITQIAGAYSDELLKLLLPEFTSDEKEESVRDSYFDEGVSYFNDMIDADKKNPIPYNYRGILNLFFNKYDNALNDFTTSFELGHAEPWYPQHNIGLVYFETLRFSDALIQFEKAIELSPNYIEAKYYAAKANMFTGQYARASERLSALSQLPARDFRCMRISRASVFEALGDAYRAQGDFSNAVASYEKSLNVDSNCFEARLGIAESYISISDAKKARKACAEIIKKNNRSLKKYRFEAGAIHTINTALKETGVFPDSDALLDSASKSYDEEKYLIAAKLYVAYTLLVPEDATAVYNLAITLSELEEPSDSIFFFYRYLFLNPEAEDTDSVMTMISDLSGEKNN